MVEAGFRANCFSLCLHILLASLLISSSSAYRKWCPLPGSCSLQEECPCHKGKLQSTHLSPVYPGPALFMEPPSDVSTPRTRQHNTPRLQLVLLTLLVASAIIIPTTAPSWSLGGNYLNLCLLPQPHLFLRSLTALLLPSSELRDLFPWIPTTASWLVSWLQAFSGQCSLSLCRTHILFLSKAHLNSSHYASQYTLSKWELWRVKTIDKNALLFAT